MSNYTKSTNFATKDNLSPGDPLKIVRGTEIDTEFNNIATAIATKTDNSAAAITGGSITGITDLAIADGGTGASTATAAINNLLPSQTSNANKYLQTDGTNVSWDAVSLSTSDITGTLPVANGGTGVTSSTGTGSVVLSNSPTLVTPALGTPASGVATNLTGLPISTGVSGLGTGVATFLATPSSANLASAVSDETGSGALVFANSPTLVTPALGTPSSGTLTNATGLPISTGVSGLGTGVATFLGTPSSANLLAAVTDETGTGSLVFATSPTLVTPALGTPSSATLTNATGLPISTGVSGLGTGVATALAVNVGSAGAPVVNGGALGTPSSGTVTNLTGTASININGTVGATTPTTGAFTTVAASSSVTLSGGTANGVTYLNGSKVLTSGSALTFDGTNLGIGISSPASKLDVYGATNTEMRLSSGTYGYLLFGQYANGAFIGPSSSDATIGVLRLGTVGTERLRIDTSGNVGVGTTSPTSLLSVLNASSGAKADFVQNSTTTGDYTGMSFGVTASSVSGYKKGGVFFERTGAGGIGKLHLANNPLTDTSNVSLTDAKLTIDSAGLVGIGTSSPSTRLHVKSADNTTASVIVENLNSTNGILQFGSASSSYQILGGAYQGQMTYNTGAGTPHIFWIGGSEKLRLDASGNLGLGVTPSAWSASGVLQVSRASMYSSGGFTAFANNWYSNAGDKYIATDYATQYYQSSGQHVWRTAPSGTAGNAITFTQAMTLDASGRLGIGTTSPACKLNVDGTGELLRLSGTTPFMQWFGSSACYIGDASQLVSGTAGDFVIRVGNSNTNNLIFATGTTQRARIDTNGNLLVGATSVVSSSVSGLALRNGGTSGNLLSAVSSTSSVDHMIFYNPNGTCGTLYTTGTSFGLYNASDARLKQNISTADNASVLIDAIQVRKFDWKVNGEHQRYGFIAQELATVFPEAVKQPENPDEMMGVDYAKLVPMLVKAIQELKAEFDAYKASHP